MSLSSLTYMNADAILTKSIKIQSSVIGYIAKCVALIGKGDTHAGCRVFDIAFFCFRSDYLCILLLIKVCFYATQLGPLLTCSFALGCGSIYGRIP